jgi:hypothetical protein
MLSGRVGFDELRKYAEQSMMEQYRRTLPNIRSSLFSQRAALIAGDALQTAEARQFSAEKLSAFVAATSKTIEKMFGGIPEHLEAEHYAKTLEQEYELLRMYTATAATDVATDTNNLLLCLLSSRLSILVRE